MFLTRPVIGPLTSLGAVDGRGRRRRSCSLGDLSSSPCRRHPPSPSTRPLLLPQPDMTLILHGLRRSTCVQRVLVCAHQYSVPIRLAEVTTYADAQKPDWLERNPFGRMPVLEDDDDGFVLYGTSSDASWQSLSRSRSRSSCLLRTSSARARRVPSHRPVRRRTCWRTPSRCQKGAHVCSLAQPCLD